MKLPRLLLGLLFVATLSARAQDVQGLVNPFISVSLASPTYVQEVIDAILVKEGDRIEKDQVLVELRKVREELAVQEAIKLVENAKFVAEGTEKLAKERIGSQEQALKARTEWELSKIKLEAAKVALKEKTVRSPLSGIVVRKYKEPGESVDRGEKLVDIVNIDQVFVQFYLEPKLMPSLIVGQTINVRVPVLVSGSFQGKVDFVDPRIDAASGLFRVKVLVDNPDQKIKAGMRAVADFPKKG